MRRSGFLSIVFASCVILVAASRPHAAQAQHGAAAAPQAARAAQPSDDTVARGRYIVENIATCWRCHSPVDVHGEREAAHWLMGGQVGTRPTIPAGDWAIVAPRLAGAPPGTDAEFIHLMMTGISRRGTYLRQPMPQFRMSQADAEAVLAYLKSLGDPHAVAGRTQLAAAR